MCMNVDTIQCNKLQLIVNMLATQGSIKTKTYHHLNLITDLFPTITMWTPIGTRGTEGVFWTRKTLDKKNPSYFRKALHAEVLRQIFLMMYICYRSLEFF